MCPPPTSVMVEAPTQPTKATELLMRTSQSHTALEDLRMPVQAKLAAAWTSFMFLYVYVDIFYLYMPGTIDDILVGVVWEFDVSQVFVTGALTLMAVPILMVLLSMTLPARANRLMNLVVASVYVVVSAFNALCESWTYYFTLAIGLEVIVLALILRYAWTWPRRTTSPAATATSLDTEPLRMRRQA
jgi:hypothetical protein